MVLVPNVHRMAASHLRELWSLECVFFFSYQQSLIIRECIYVGNEMDISLLVFMVTSYSRLLMLAWGPALRAGKVRIVCSDERASWAMEYRARPMDA